MRRLCVGRESSRCYDRRVSSGETEVATAGALVLVADDEVGIRLVARRVLERAGFRVCMAAHGREAVDVYVANRTEIRAVLLDLTMPRLRGDEVLRELRQLDPDVRVVITSGFEGTSLATQDGHVVFLAKPWTPKELVAALRDVLA